VVLDKKVAIKSTHDHLTNVGPDIPLKQLWKSMTPFKIMAVVDISRCHCYKNITRRKESELGIELPGFVLWMKLFTYSFNCVFFLNHMVLTVLLLLDLTMFFPEPYGFDGVIAVNCEHDDWCICHARLFLTISLVVYSLYSC
jgi:hypothetical protein